MSILDRDEDDRPCCTSCSGTRKVEFTCAVCLKDVCEGCYHENANGECVCPEHAP